MPPLRARGRRQSPRRQLPRNAAAPLSARLNMSRRPVRGRCTIGDAALAIAESQIGHRRAAAADLACTGALGHPRSCAWTSAQSRVDIRDIPGQEEGLGGRGPRTGRDRAAGSSGG